MKSEKIIFAVFILLALTLNFGFFIGEIDNPDHHHASELFAALVVSLIATVLKFGDKSHVGTMLLASSFVADIQLIAASVIWAVAIYALELEMTPSIMASIVSLSGGALLANLVSVILLMVEASLHRH